ncbi:PREDICTED: cGMP-dependent 3',5'-cyclic phosphodiesterase-like [Acropora digitifera]|uniref:cGMP-dependent 3',5'-cyclic phosphodiesterase-like n=1 Tax=Acropora digitifera TaxID=70779 RepID=UPI00077A0BA2|nr:PREDICTED: cGMP-dependent 3',5'-cyclic phosphodiesterase-like [Acropora digitifera]
MLCVPIVSIKTGIVIAVACVFNKKLNRGRFSSSEEDNAVFCCENIAAHLEHTLEWEREMVIKRQQEHLLKVAKNLFTLVDDVSVLLSEIMSEARKLTNAERCSVFLWDKERDELVAKVFDGEIPNDGTGVNGKEPEVRIPVTQGIVGCVATTGKMLNIKDAYSHPLFYKGLDEKTGFRTRNILCFPIKDEEEVIGVAQLCNKINGSCFTKFDEDLTRAFAIYCGVSIFHSLLYKNAKEAYNRSRLSSEMMIYHMTVTQSEVDLLFSKKICSTKEIHPEFCLFSSTPRNILQDSMIPACLCMFEDLGMIEKWKIPKEVLVRFLLMVRKGYRNPPYHNWIHAFTVAHFCYLLFKNARITHQLRDIELLALFVACLCHDIDHRGTTNSFQVSSGSTLAALYSSKGSVLEEDYKDVFILIRDIILATDLAHHLRILQDLREMAEHGFDSGSSDHRKLLLFLLMTASDLSDQTKNWEGTRGTAGLIYSEFFSQGDKEKHMGLTPMEMMDRERAVIPKLQIDFLDAIALPVYRLLSSLLPETQEVLETVLSNRQKWQKAQEDGDYVYRPVATSDKEIQLTVNGSDYKDVFILIRDIILATDLAHHLRILQDLRKMAEDGFDSDSSDHRKLLLFLLMTASDLSDQTKNWEGTRGTAGLIYSEFFSQGDKEKHMGLTPMEMMDRERAVIPKLQIDFLDAIALPVYRLLSSLLPETQEVLETVLSNRQKWQKAQEDGDYVYRPVATSDKEIQLTVNGSVPETCQ